jgi:hypothetical protein
LCLKDSHCESGSICDLLNPVFANNAHDDAHLCVSSDGAWDSPCVSDEHCQEGSICYADFDYGGNVCKRPGEYGYPCGSKRGCGDSSWSCEGDDSLCAYGLHCSLQGSQLHCLTLRKEGEFCPANFRCADGLICVYGKCRAPGSVECALSYTAELFGVTDWNGEYAEVPLCGMNEHLDIVEQIVCNRSYDPPGCDLPGSLGSDCYPNFPCQDGLTCDTELQPPVCE